MRKKKPTEKKPKFIDITKNIIPEFTEIQHKNRLIARTDNQKEFIRNMVENEVVFCQGLAGSGKTHIAIGMAIEYLLKDKVGKIVITRPGVEAGEKIGVLPGSAKEQPNQGEVVAVGSGALLDSGEVRALQLSVGDTVVFGGYAGNTIKVDGEELIIMRENEIFGVIE